jgi:hypothetical protein
MVACSQVIGLSDLTRTDRLEATCVDCDRQADAQDRVLSIADAKAVSDTSRAVSEDARTGTTTDAGRGQDAEAGPSDGADASLADGSPDADPTSPPAGPLGSCLDLLRAGTTKNGVYAIDVDGTGPSPPFDVYCEMNIEGGGFTLALKADGRRPTFLYDMPIWTDAKLLNETNTNPDSIEAKFQSFVTMPASEVLLGVRGLSVSGPARYLRIPVKTSSLRALFSGPFVPTTRGRGAWKQLLPGSSLQLNCNAEGFNNTVGLGMRLRLGIVANEQNDCDSPNSFLGIGYQSELSWCNEPRTMTTSGNFSSCVGDNGKLNLPAFVALYVRAN